MTKGSQDEVSSDYYYMIKRNPFLKELLPST